MEEMLGGARITYLGHSTFRFVTAGGEQIIIDAFLSSSIALDDGTVIYAGEPLGYVIEFESGFKLYHAGDTAVFGDMRLIGEIYNPDLAMLPIGNQVVMSPLEAAHPARL